jgi:transposase InsO family protein
MDLQDTSCHVKYLIRDRDAKYPPLFDAILADAGIRIVLSGVRVPRMNSICERWVLTCRRELLDPSPDPGSRKLVRHRRRHSGGAVPLHRWPSPSCADQARPPITDHRYWTVIGVRTWVSWPFIPGSQAT